MDQHAGGKWLIHDTKRRKDKLRTRKISYKHIFLTYLMIFEFFTTDSATRFENNQQ